MNKRTLAGCIIGLMLSPLVLAETAIEQELKARCFATFEMMEQQDLDNFIAQIPVKPSKRELKFAKKMLSNKHKKWFIESGGITSKVFSSFEYKTPDKDKIERYAALDQLNVKLRVNTGNYESYTYCSYVRTAKGWFLSSLP